MNKVDAALGELRRSEEELAGAFAKTAEQLPAEHEVFYACGRFAEQCHAHAAEFQRYDAEPSLAPLLESFRELYLQAQDVAFHWLVAGQLAQATRDEELIALVDELQQETQNQIAWLEAQVKQSAPQALVVGSAD